MKIVLISNYKPDGQQSMLRYPEMLRRTLASHGHAVRVVHPPVVFGRFVKTTQRGFGKWIGYLDKYILARGSLPWQCRGADVVHVCDHSNAMYLRCAGRKPRLITCHDLIAVRSARGELNGIPTRRTGQWLQRWILLSLGNARTVICDSLATEQDVRRLVANPALQTRVNYLPLNRSCAPASEARVHATREKFGLGPSAPYFIHISGNERYKNRSGVLGVFAELRKYPYFEASKVVLAGKPWNEDLRARRRSLHLEDSAIETGPVSDEDLEALYTGAEALLYPSLIEGYGWPLLEAQACGCLVITTNRRPMTEVAGNGAIYILPEDEAGAARMIVQQWAGRDAIREAGFLNLERFTDDPFAETMYATYVEVVDSWAKPRSR